MLIVRDAPVRGIFSDLNIPDPAFGGLRKEYQTIRWGQFAAKVQELAWEILMNEDKRLVLNH